MIKERLNTILIHCAGWLIFFSLPVIFIISSANDNHHLFSGNILAIVGFGIYIPIFYLHTYFLFPKLFSGRKRMFYFLSILLLFALVFFMKPFEQLAFHNRNLKDEMSKPAIMNVPFAAAIPNDSTPAEFYLRRPPFLPPAEFRDQRRPSQIDIISIALFMMVLILSIALILEKRWRIAVQETARAEADKANAELSFLKAQINPHFLFNTLNNIYSLAVTKNENAADAIMKLSNLMRYVTDDVNEDFVPLEKEVDSIGDYISLQRLRLGKKVTISFTVEGDISNKEISPLILMPFVENVFKHGISNAADSPIVIKLTAFPKYIVFYTENRLFATPRNVERTGIGSANTKQRLAAIYPGRHLLEIGAQNDLYTVHLVMYI